MEIIGDGRPVEMREDDYQPMRERLEAIQQTLTRIGRLTPSVIYNADINASFITRELALFHYEFPRR